MTRAFPALVLALLCVNTSVVRASCQAPRSCTVITVTVETCAAIQPETHGMVGRFITALKQDKRNQDAERIRKMYRGALVTGKLKTHQTVEGCNTRQKTDEKALWLPPFVQHEGQPVRLFLSTTESEQACKRVLARTSPLTVVHVSPCCDGDPGLPCLLYLVIWA